MSTHVLLLLLCVHSLGLGVDLGNSLDRREGESTRALIHGSESFQKKADSLYILNDIHNIQAEAGVPLRKNKKIAILALTPALNLTLTLTLGLTLKLLLTQTLT